VWCRLVSRLTILNGKSTPLLVGSQKCVDLMAASDSDPLKAQATT
jgi:hypothetical protein